MNEQNPLLKKLQYKNKYTPVLVLNPPDSYQETLEAFEEVHTHAQSGVKYEFVQAFATSNEQLQYLGRIGVAALEEDGLIWLCYPKKSSKIYKEADTCRESVAALLVTEGFTPVRQVAIDKDWSAIRLRRKRGD